MCSLIPLKFRLTPNEIIIRGIVASPIYPTTFSKIGPIGSESMFSISPSISAHSRGKLSIFLKLFFELPPKLKVNAILNPKNITRLPISENIAVNSPVCPKTP